MVETPGRLTLWGVEVFVAAAEDAAISAAAKRLGASVSSVSQQLANLEAALGTVLIDRSARPLRLTPAGRVFLPRARAVLNEVTQARAELAMQDLSHQTRFRLGMIEDFEADVTPRLLARMSDRLSQSQFLLETGASHRLADLLDTRALDMIVAAEMGAEADWMEVHPLMEEPFVAAVPAALASGQEPLSDALKRLPLIQYTARHYMGRQIEAHLARQNLTLAHRFELDSYHAIMAMVANGAGWTILTPLGYLRAQRFSDQTAMMPLPFAPLSRRIMLSARKGVLQDMPGEVSLELRGLLRELVVAPALQGQPWLRGKLRVLGPSSAVNRDG